MAKYIKSKLYIYKLWTRFNILILIRYISFIDPLIIIIIFEFKIITKGLINHNPDRILMVFLNTDIYKFSLTHIK